MHQALGTDANLTFDRAHVSLAASKSAETLGKQQLRTNANRQT